jgi:hypothetical protein
MPGFTDEELNYQAGMEELIDLYYLLSEQRDKQWFSEIVLKDIPPKIVDKMANLFYKTIPGFSQYQYYPSKPLFRFGSGGEITVFKRRHLESFLDIMDALREDLWKRNIKGDLIKVESIRYEVPRSSKRHSSLGGQTRRQKAAARFNWHQPQTDPRYRSGDSPTGEVIAGSNSRDEVRQLFMKRSESVGPSPGYDEKFEVICHPDSLFADALYTAVLDDSPVENPQDSAETSFIKAIRYILTKFAALHGSLDRIKVCLNCGRFLLERKSKSQKFCQNNKKCENQYKKKLAKQEKAGENTAPCRKRQNEWIDYTLRNHEACDNLIRRSTGYNTVHVKISDCLRQCSTVQKVAGGACPVLRRNNEAIFSRLEKYRIEEGRIRSKKRAKTDNKKPSFDIDDL